MRIHCGGILGKKRGGGGAEKRERREGEEARGIRKGKERERDSSIDFYKSCRQG